MWKLIGISILLSAILIGIGFATLKHYQKPLFTSSYFLKLSRDITLLHTYNPFTVVINTHLFTISSHERYINIESSDWTYKKCQINVDEKDKITGRIQAAVLGEKILVWGFDEIDYENFEEDVKRANFNLLMLDPWRCRYKVLGHFEHSDPKIVVKKNSVDVLCSDRSENCIPCRFNVEGKKFELKHQIIPESWEYAFIESFNQDHNYVYAFNNRHGRAVMKILDQDFNIQKQANVNFSIEQLAVSSLPTKSHIGILYEEPKHQFHITVFNSNLQPIFTSKLHEPDEYEPFMSYLTMDSRGNSFATTVLTNKTEKYHLLRYDVDGYLIAEVDIDEYWRNEPLVTQTFLIDDREFCLVNHFKVYDIGSFGRTYIKCIDVS